MKPAPFNYHAPENVDEALGLVAELENAKVLAGGQSLMPMMNFRFAQPDHLIDMNRVASLAGIKVSNGSLEIGAMTRQRDIEFSAEVADRAPILQQALAHVGHRQTRNRGTIGGSLCHLDPTAELANCVSVHDGAVLHARSAKGRRDLKMTEFALAYMTHGLQEDEILVGVTLPTWSPRHGSAFVELARRQGDFAIAGVAVLVELEAADGPVSRVAISIAGATAMPVRPVEAENMVLGQKPSDEHYKAASEAVAITDLLSDSYVSADYRAHLARVLTRRALAEAVGRAQQRWRDV